MHGAAIGSESGSESELQTTHNIFYFRCSVWEVEKFSIRLGQIPNIPQVGILIAFG